MPTPIDANRQPDLGALRRACGTRRARPCARADIVVVESTVYPGRHRGGMRAAAGASSSGLRQGVDFQLGYSPERINPGDREHRLETIPKVIAG